MHTSKSGYLNRSIQFNGRRQKSSVIGREKYPTSYASDVVGMLDKLIGLKLSQNFTCMDIATQYIKGSEGYKDKFKESPVKYHAMEKVIETGSNYIISRCNDIVE